MPGVLELLKHSPLGLQFSFDHRHVAILGFDKSILCVRMRTFLLTLDTIDILCLVYSNLGYKNLRIRTYVQLAFVKVLLVDMFVVINCDFAFIFFMLVLICNSYNRYIINICPYLLWCKYFLIFIARPLVSNIIAHYYLVAIKCFPIRALVLKWDFHDMLTEDKSLASPWPLVLRNFIKRKPEFCLPIVTSAVCSSFRSLLQCNSRVALPRKFESPSLEPFVTEYAALLLTLKTRLPFVWLVATRMGM